MDRALLRLQGVRPVLFLLSLFSVAQGAAIIAQALWLAQALTMLFQGRPVADALQPLILFACAFTARHTLIWLQRVVAGRFADRSSQSLRLQLVERLFKLGPGYASRNGSGKLITLSMDGVDRFRTYVELALPRALDMALITLPVLVSIYLLDLISGLILTFTMPVLIGFFILLGYAARRMADKQWHSYQVLAHHFTDALRGLETLRFLGRSKAHAGAVERVSDQYRSATMRTLRVAFLSSFALDFFSTLSVAFVAVGLGLRLISGTLGLEAALTVLLLAPEFFQPVRQLGSDYHASLDGKEAGQAMRNILNEGEPAARDGKTKENQNGTISLLNETASVSASREGRIELRAVDVQGDEGHLQLSGITATLDPSIHKIGIVGMSGAGKTTLLNVLGGFLEPTTGDILVDGRPLTGETKREWQRQLALIPQHPYLFSGSIADNVRFYDPDVSEEQVRAALCAVGLAELVRQLPHGIDEQIGEGGRTLSGGQAQRVALARALAANRNVLLLDEPTAHLDIETELELKETMLGLFGRRRVFLATHRLHWMQEMDWIWVLKDGRLVQAGTPEQLLAEQGVYRELLTTMTRGG
jgi:ATP-binding cassette subfamily C protein CydD